MLKSLKKKMKDQAGLTLIELLVVIVILGIIAAVAVPMVMGNREDASRNTNAQNLTVLQDAVNRHYAVSDTALSDLDDLVTNDLLDSVPTIMEFNGCTGEFDLDTDNETVIVTGEGQIAACTQE